MPIEDQAVPFAAAVNTADPDAALQLLAGFHKVEQNSWRWTMAKFAVALKTPENAGRRGVRLTLDYSLPEAVVARLGPLTLSAAIAGHSLGSLPLVKPGTSRFEAEVPPSLLQQDVIAAELTLDKFLPAGTADERELGIVVSRIALEAR